MIFRDLILLTRSYRSFPRASEPLETPNRDSDKSNISLHRETLNFKRDIKDSRDSGGVPVRTIQSTGAVGLRLEILGCISAGDSHLQMR